MGEKRKARMTNNERKSKKEKKVNHSVVKSASNDDIEEQSSMHSNGSTSDSNSHQPSVTQENNIPDNIEEFQTVPPIEVETVTSEEHPESPSSSTEVELSKINSESISARSWWSSLARLFHFGNHTTESKTPLENNSDSQPSAALINEHYLSNVKCRRSLRGDAIVG